MATLRVKPVILGWKSDLTEHLALTSDVTHSIFLPPYLCTNSLKGLQTHSSTVLQVTFNSLHDVIRAPISKLHGSPAL